MWLVLESHPYTQNHYLFENITKQRNRLRKQRALKGAQRLGSGASITLTPQELQKWVAEQFEHDDNMSCEEHVAREMQIILDAYGKVGVHLWAALIKHSCLLVDMAQVG